MIRSLNYGRHLIEQYLKSINYYNNILDLGAGNGYDLMTSKRINPHASLYALDSHPVNIEELKRKEVVAFQVDLEKERYPFEDEDIDIIIMNQVLEHIKEIYWVFHETSRVLKIGGKVIIGVPNLASLHNRLLLLFGKQPNSIKSYSAHIRGFTKEDILFFLNRCLPGCYRMLSFGGSNFYPFPPFLAKRLANYFPNMAWGIFLMIEKQKKYNNEVLTYLNKEKLETNFYQGISPWCSVKPDIYH